MAFLEQCETMLGCILRKKKTDGTVKRNLVKNEREIEKSRRFE